MNAKIKRIVAIFLTLLLIVSTVGTFVSCDKKEASTVEKLSKEEYEIYLIVTENLYKFKDPSSVIIGLAYKAVNGCAVLYINANDSLGITRGEFYCVFIEDYFFNNGSSKFEKGTMLSTEDVSYTLSTAEDKRSFMNIINGLSDAPHYDELALNDALIEYRLNHGIT